MPQLVSKLKNSDASYWGELPTKQWPKPAQKFIDMIEAAGGLVDETFALAQSISLSDVKELTEGLRKACYRPSRCRPYYDGHGVKVAIVWQRDQTDWQLDFNLSAQDAEQRATSWQMNGFSLSDVAGYRQPNSIAYLLLSANQQQPPDVKLFLGMNELELSHYRAQISAASFIHQFYTLQVCVDENGTNLYSGFFQSTASAQKWALDLKAPEASIAAKLTPIRRQMDVCIYHPEWNNTSNVLTSPDMTGDANVLISSVQRITDGVSQLFKEEKFAEAINVLDVNSEVPTWFKLGSISNASSSNCGFQQLTIRH